MFPESLGYGKCYDKALYEKMQNETEAEAEKTGEKKKKVKQGYQFHKGRAPNAMAFQDNVYWSLIQRLHPEKTSRRKADGNSVTGNPSKRRKPTQVCFFFFFK